MSTLNQTNNKETDNIIMVIEQTNNNKTNLLNFNANIRELFKKFNNFLLTNNSEYVIELVLDCYTPKSEVIGPKVEGDKEHKIKLSFMIENYDIKLIVENMTSNIKLEFSYMNKKVPFGNNIINWNYIINNILDLFSTSTYNTYISSYDIDKIRDEIDRYEDEKFRLKEERQKETFKPMTYFASFVVLFFMFYILYYHWSPMSQPPVNNSFSSQMGSKIEKFKNFGWLYLILSAINRILTNIGAPGMMGVVLTSILIFILHILFIGYRMITQLINDFIDYRVNKITGTRSRIDYQTYKITELIDKLNRLTELKKQVKQTCLSVLKNSKNLSNTSFNLNKLKEEIVNELPTAEERRNLSRNAAEEKRNLSRNAAEKRRAAAEERKAAAEERKAVAEERKAVAEERKAVAEEVNNKKKEVLKELLNSLTKIPT